MKKLQHNPSRATFKLMVCLAVLAAVRGLSAQTAFHEASLTQPAPVSGMSSSLAVSEGSSEPQMESPKSATVYYSRSKSGKGAPSGSDPAPPPTPPRFEIMGAYARWSSPYSTVNGQTLLPLTDGGVVSGTYYVDRNVGLEVEGSYYEQTTNDGIRGGSLGPVYRFVLPHVLVRLHGLVGSEKFLGPIYSNSAAGTFYANPPVWSTVLTPGGSADFAIPATHGHLALRAQVDYQYIHASYGPAGTFNGGQVNINSYRIVPGLVFRLGHTADGPRRSQKSNSY